MLNVINEIHGEINCLEDRAPTANKKGISR